MTEQSPSSDVETRELAFSVVVPVYNGARTLRELVQRLEPVLAGIAGDAWEILLVDDGSRDGSDEVADEIARAHPRVVVLHLTRNFGQHNALMCGFSMARGALVVTLDDDLQNPPEEIEKLVGAMDEGCDVVYGIPCKKRHPWARNLGSEFVQWMYRRTFGLDVRVSAFRLLRRHVVRRLLAYDMSFSYIDGLIAWFTTRIKNVRVEHHERTEGCSGYSPKRLVFLALDMVTTFSISPIEFASLLGLAFSVVGFASGLYFFLKKVFLGIPVSGFTSTFVAITVFAGIQLLTIGILGEYIGRIHINVSKRPQYAIREIVTHEGRKHPDEDPL